MTAIDAETATVHVGAVADLEVWTLTGEKPVFTSGAAPHGPVECAVQVRAHGGIADAVAELRGGDLVADLRAPLRGVAPGQTMVLYRPDAGRRRSHRQRHDRAQPAASPGTLSMMFVMMMSGTDSGNEQKDTSTSTTFLTR